MKRVLLGICLGMQGVFAVAQNGLEGIIVEKYYVADARDAAATGGKLPAGSVTYRIFVDMPLAYRLQAVYGVYGHELRIATTTNFYNNERGAVIANDVPADVLAENTILLDSWLSVGAGASGTYAVLKSDDTTAAIVNKDGLLQNADPSAGIPIKVRDGLFRASPQSAVNFYGMDTSLLAHFKRNSATKGEVFSTQNTSWASFGGAIGPPPQNRVLIAQITTDGVLSFELNLQIGSPDGTFENYVARNPKGSEIQYDGLIYPVPQKVKSEKK